jgi:hypothetical protein
MAINPAHYGSFTFKDFSDENSSMSFNFPAVTALNIAAFLADFGDLRTATEDIVLGTLSADSWTGDRTKYSAAPPTDVNAQRERKFMFIYEDTVTLTPGRVEVPTADFTGRLVDDTDKVDLTNTEIAAWVAAFETLARTDDGNTLNVLEGRAVGRNL